MDSQPDSVSHDHPLLAGLNPPQRAAVLVREGPLMILAGAGSGKTRVLTRRLAWLVMDGACRAEEILAVTFTNKAARQMRDRVAQLLADHGPWHSGRLWIGTFHALAARMLRAHAETLGFSSDFTILDTADQKRLIKGMIDQLDYKSSYWTNDRLANSFSRWKDDALGPDEIGENQVRNPRDLEGVRSFFRAYQDELRRSNCMDFGDLLRHCLVLWQREPAILEGYRTRFRQVLVDEYQDTNLVQYRWLMQLSAQHRNLCVVGDDDQSIYSWRGARLDNILRFSEDYPETQVVRLEQNYRSTGHILQAASSLIHHNTGRMAKTLWTSGSDGTKVVKYAAEDSEDEARFIATEISDQARNQEYNRFAILVRTSHQTRAMEEALMQRTIPYQIVGGLRFMDRAEVRDAMAYLRLVHSGKDNLAFERILNVPPRGLGAVALETIQVTAGEQGGSLLDAAVYLLESGTTLATRSKKPLQEFVGLIMAARSRQAEEPPVKTLEFLLLESGYIHALDRDERRTDKLENLQELKNELGRRKDLTTFLEDAALIADMMEHADTPETGERVLISTLHAAKGLEFAVVFLAGMEEELLPHKLSLEAPAGLEEERRLAYVGMTRAKEKLYLTYARRRWLFNHLVVGRPSRFLQEIPAEVLHDRSLQTRVRRGPGGGGFYHRR
ncbi:MAG: UvrD-helicase domain-containing protein [Magnetococcales bacterium]|nr:UvrD-helicase domain-containing protein [Magnetococcales bacterium]